MPDEDLVRYIAAARKAGERAHAETGMHLFLYRHEARMRLRVATKVPRHLRHHSETVADWVLTRVTASLLELPVRGESVGEYVNYYNAAIGGRVIDFFRTTQGKTLERQVGLPSEHEGDAPDTLGVDFDEERVARRVDVEAVVDEALAQLSERDAAIVRRAIWDDQPTRLVAEEFGMQPEAVDQVKSRFRASLRRLCEARGITGT